MNKLRTLSVIFTFYDCLVSNKPTENALERTVQIQNSLFVESLVTPGRGTSLMTDISSILICGCFH